MRMCRICRKAIKPGSRAKKYCSDECRKRVKYEKDRAWVKANPGKMNDYARKWREKNPEVVLQRGRDAYRKRCLKKLESEKI